MRIKIVMIFWSWLFCWNLCFSKSSGFVSILHNFVLEVKSGYFSLILEVFVELLQVESCQYHLPRISYDFSKSRYQWEPQMFNLLLLESYVFLLILNVLDCVSLIFFLRYGCVVKKWSMVWRNCLWLEWFKEIKV